MAAFSARNAPRDSANCSRSPASATSMRDCMINHASTPEATAAKPGTKIQNSVSMRFMLTPAHATYQISKVNKRS